MWDSSYFDMDYVNANGETERMIADGYDQFDSRHVAHLSGDRFGSGGLYDHNGSDGSGNVSNLGWGNAGFGGGLVNSGTAYNTATDVHNTFNG